ncbi:MAG TPA: sigma-70 family RNA polymerase sigma factor [Planctomycetota bacterium]|jgi:RNA polymerase sigma-70 factor (ECF subfamily)|nr:sigma-70 family RNA polymerase sigma factor [Planctomycetota bacterium]
MTTPLDPGQLDALVVSAQGGDRQAFSQVVVEVYPQLAGFLAFHAPTPELMDEILQATFVAAFQQLDDYEPRGSFAGWLKGIARNLLRRELSRRARLQGTDREAIEALLADTALQVPDEPSDDETKHQQLARLRGCLERLSPRMRLIAERRFVEDVPLNVLAQQFKQTRASIAKIIFTVRRDLRACAERAPGSS